MNVTAFKLKIAGLLFLCFPLLIIIILGIGEMTGGMLSGIQHFVQAVPLVVLGYFAWKKPSIGGKTLIVISSILTILYLIYPPGGFSISFRFINALILFGPIILSGVLFWVSSKRT